MIGKILKALDPVIDAELDRAQWEKGKTFASPHEGYAVIKEELDEMSDEAIRMWDILEEVWTSVKNDIDVPGDMLFAMRSAANRAAAEAVQVSAMCEKFLISKYSWRTKNKEDDDE